MWAVEVYYEDFLNANPIIYARIHANEAVTTEANSFNDNFALFIRVWQQLSETERTSHHATAATFRSFLHSVVGPTENTNTHWIPLPEASGVV